MYKITKWSHTESSKVDVAENNLYICMSVFPFNNKPDASVFK